MSHCLFSDNDDEDIILSQNLDDIEKELAVINNIENDDDDIILSQILDNIEKELAEKNNIEKDVDYGELNLISTAEEFVKAEMEKESDYGEFNLISTAEEHVKEEVKSVVVERFQTPVSQVEIDTLIHSQTNANTRKNTKWSLNIFNEWRKCRSKGDNDIPELQDMTAEELDYWLQRFLVELRKMNGDEYSPKSVYYIICRLMRHLKDHNIYINILEEADKRFVLTRKVLDAKMKELVSKGVGCKPKTADPVSNEDEDKLWNSGVFGFTNSTSLQYTVFFYACKLFGLRGRDEHRHLEADQFELGNDKNGYYIRYIGRNNKTFTGGLAHLKLKNKDIKHYCTNYGGQRCLYTVFKTYLDAIESGIFYRKPLQNGIRYGKQPVGINKLGNFMKEMCQQAGLVGYYTNHSGKKTCATEMYRNGQDEQSIMERTGHRSVEACRVYKIKSDEMQKQISSVLEAPISAKENSEPVSKKAKISASSPPLKDTPP
ncbi:zinc finger MYM-type protein 2-like [Patella vulgata]|uniref:zinc finger MYM-type protein 2-like n=1 Tax=Patella vulgata TaxID=6465 RepID=UPI0024A9EBB2|nr:zinc finger MYM-type protein 2-like [Patella vulgata]